MYTEITDTPLEYVDTNLRFFIRCHALGFTVLGAGVTKKTAKHDAADKLLRKYRRNYDEDDDAEDEDEAKTAVDSNYITELLDYCTLKDFHKPSFDCIDSYGPSHAPSFTFECKLDSIRREATADNKKLAKQLSAKAVLEEIKMMVSGRDGVYESFFQKYDDIFRASRIWKRNCRTSIPRTLQSRSVRKSQTTGS